MWPLDGVDGDPMGQLNGAPIAIPNLVPGCATTNPSSGRHGLLQYINPNCFTNAVAPNAAFFNAAPPFGCDKSFIAPGMDPLTCINLLGNLGRNSIIGPGLLNVDFSAVKDNRIHALGEALNLQFRAEMFNILNRANFSAVPANNLEALDSSGSSVAKFGRLDAPLQVPTREIQFALKLIW
jgi:hypothetical protein